MLTAAEPFKGPACWADDMAVSGWGPSNQSHRCHGSFGYGEEGSAMSTQTIYKIRSKKTGEFSKGGTWPSFSKKGKIWSALNHLSNHFNQLGSSGRQMYKSHECEVVVYELIESEVASSDVQEWMEASADRRADREKKEKLRIAAARLEHERQNYERLKAQFEK